MPTTGEAWTFLLGSLVPLLLLSAYRLVIAHSMVEEMRGVDWWRVPAGEIEFWMLWSFWWWIGFKVVGRFARTAYRVLFHGLSLIVAILSLLDLAYFQTSGSRSDWEMLTYGMADVHKVWPVVSSELSPARWALVVATALLLVFPAFRRWPEDRPSWLSTVLWLALLFPAVNHQINKRPKAAERLRPLQAGFCEVLFWDVLSRRASTVTWVDPATIVDLEIKAAPDVVRPNVVVVVLESVGAKHTTPYTSSLRTTPNLQRMADAGIRAEHMFSVVPHTSKSLVTMMCGEWPYLHAEVREVKGGGLPSRCLPELLGEVGYRSAFFQTAREDFEDRVDLVRALGFQRFYPKAVLAADQFESSNYFGLDDFAMLEPGLRWAKESPGTPFFMTFLTLASHHGYTLPTTVEPKSWAGDSSRVGNYRAAVHYVDRFLGDLVDGFEAAGLMENTVFIVIGDHGEAFGEHGRYQHDLVIWDEGLRIPFVMYGPAVLGPPQVLTGNRQQIDMLPTVLELAKVEITAGSPRGQSLFTDVGDRALFHSCWRSGRCLAKREGNEKFIDHYGERGVQLFDIGSDAQEHRNRADTLSAAEVTTRTDALRDWVSLLLGTYDARLERWKAAAQVPDTTTPALHRWDGRIEGLSCKTDHDRVYPGEAIWVDCAWRVTEEVTEAVRIVGTVTAGDTSEEDRWTPGRGSLPIWEWKPGHVVRDSFRAHVPATAPPGPATVSVAWRTYGGRALADDDPVWEVAKLEVLPRPNGPFTGKPDTLGDEIELTP